MKKFFFTIILLVATICQANAQSLYKTVYENAIGIVNKASSTQEQVDINQFEVTVLNYIQAQVTKRGLKKDGYFYDSQAVNMKSFVDDFRYYVNKARQVSAAKRLEVFACYRDASLQNPLFNDTDKDRALVYVNDKKTYTPFSLDTDWEKAYEQASANIKSIIR